MSSRAAAASIQLSQLTHNCATSLAAAVAAAAAAVLITNIQIICTLLSPAVSLDICISFLLCSSVSENDYLKSCGITEIYRQFTCAMYMHTIILNASNTAVNSVM